MYILPLVGYAGVLLGFGFLTLAIASGLYYLSELVEEHTVVARKLLTRLIYTVIATQTLLALIDHFPWLLSSLSIASHAIYMGNLRYFPIVKLSDPVFIVSCREGPPYLAASKPIRSIDRLTYGETVLVLLNHFLWFRHFSHPPPSSRTYPTSLYDRPDIPTFTEIASYFGICVWLVPFALFVSLSAGENVLPSMGSEYATGGNVGGGPSGDGGLGGVGDNKARRKKGLVKAGVDWVVESVRDMGFGRGEKETRF